MPGSSALSMILAGTDVYIAHQLGLRSLLTRAPSLARDEARDRNDVT